MDFLKSLSIANSGLKAQSGRMRVIAENIANADSTSPRPGGDPYRRRIPTFSSKFNRELEAQVVQLGKVKTDTADFQRKYDPGNPGAGPDGYVKMPNVNSLVEQMDMREAQRSYEANLNVIGATRRMIQRTLELMRA